MNIDQIFAPNVASQQTGSKKELGQEDFLKLLVTQLKNQDPSNPADNAEFLSQIAQFSMVSGIDDLGTSFNGVANNLYTAQAMQATDLVGREVLTETDSVLWTAEEGSSVSGVLEVPELTNGLNIQVRDIHGTLIKTLEPGSFKEGASAFTWDGTDESGEPLEPGVFTISATALLNGKQEALPVQIYQRVESITVDRASQSVALQLGNNAQIPFSQISQYR